MKMRRPSRENALAVPAMLALFVTALGIAPAFAQVQPAAPAGPAMPQDAGDMGPAEATVHSNREYRIRQGDEVTVTIFGEPTLTPPAPLRVVQGGTIALPLVGEVTVGGMTTAAAADAVARALHRYVRQPRVTVAIYSVGPVEALVLGNVKIPGKYTLPPPARLTDVIAAAGGLGPTDGDLPAARLETPEGTTSTVSLQALLHNGDESQNVTIESGETVYIPSPATFTVDVLGAVDHGGDIIMHEGDDVVAAVARAGVSSGNVSPDLNRVVVKRVNPDGTSKIMVVNLYPIIKEGDLSHDVKLQKGDIVSVPIAPKHVSVMDIFSHIPIPYGY